MRHLRLADYSLVALLFLLPSESVAQPSSGAGRKNAEVVNGCGSGWSAWLVPDSIPVLQCNLTEACNQHDLCYGKCEGRARDLGAPECEYLRCREGGDLHESEKCETDVKLVRLLSDAQQRRKSCDIALADNISARNKGKDACQAFAIVYRFAVRKWGDFAFHGLEEVVLAKEVGQAKSEYDTAIRDFFLYGTPAQFERVVHAARSGEPAVDLEKPIDFEPEKGLVNKPNGE